VRKSELSGAAIARHLGISPATFRAWLSGKHAISLETLMCSRRIWPDFIRCLVVLERKARVI
jgi:predicted transcriptional regulator